jgi:hypothetical protein
MIVIRLEACERPRTVDAPGFLPLIDELFDPLHLVFSPVSRRREACRSSLA